MHPSLAFADRQQAFKRCTRHAKSSLAQITCEMGGKWDGSPHGTGLQAHPSPQKAQSSSPDGPSEPDKVDRSGRSPRTKRVRVFGPCRTLTRSHAHTLTRSHAHTLSAQPSPERHPQPLQGGPQPGVLRRSEPSMLRAFNPPVPDVQPAHRGESPRCWFRLAPLSAGLRGERLPCRPPRPLLRFHWRWPNGRCGGGSLG